MKLSLGFSPCPNDTFIFDALVNKKIDTGEFDFEIIPEDVETLNKWSMEGRLDITKLSFPALFQNLDKYVLLNSGAALGKGVGPVLISNSKQDILNDEVKNYLVALPGMNTTANLLFSFAYPDANKKIFMRFDRIEDFVLKESPEASPFEGGLGEALGVIIHENRFTYQQKGLKKVTDLGEFWEMKMNAPVPLGGIAIKKDIDKNISLKIEGLIRKSLEFGFANYPLISDYVKKHSQEMSEDVMRKHIELYVNNFSVTLGEEGRRAITVLFETFLESHSSGDLYQLKSNSLFL